MSEAFPPHEIFQGFQAPGRFEADVFDLPITGALPRELRGTYYRLTPDPAWPPRHADPIHFEGDGAMSMFRIADGRIAFRHRYVRTERFLAERRARRALFGAYRNPLGDAAEAAGIDRSVANTAPLWFGGRLYALKEDGLPIELDPHTLATRGRSDFERQFTAPYFTAHPKIDPQSGELHCFGFNAKGPCTADLVYCCFDRDGHKRDERWLQAPYAGMMHDLALTPHHIVLALMPLTSKHERLQTGAPYFMWEPQLPSYLLVLPRRRGAQPRWFSGPARYSAHFFNAHEQGELLHVDLPCATDNALPFFPSLDGGAPKLEQAAPRITRWTVNLSQTDHTIAESLLAPWPCEYPRIDQRYQGQPQRYGFAACQDHNKPWRSRIAPQRPLLGLNSLLQFDFLSRTGQLWFAGEASLVEEPQFVPRSEREGDGYLLALVNRHDELCTDLAVLDTASQPLAPIAIARLPFRLRSGLHGCWVPGAELATEELS